MKKENLKTIYVFGAGINKCLCTSDGYSPPLAKDLFKQALSMFEDTESQLKEFYGNLFKYIETYWKLSFADLKTQDFDLEECYTMLQRQRIKAEKNKDIKDQKNLFDIEDELTNFFTKYLDDFQFGSLAHVNQEFKFLGERIYDEKATVLTFNYDTFLERIIELVSGNVSKDYLILASNSYNDWLKKCFEERKKGEIPDEIIPLSYYNWNRNLAYGIKLDEVKISTRGRSFPAISKEKYYSHPKNEYSHSPLVLKLHGSLNWWCYTKWRRVSQGSGMSTTIEYSEDTTKEGETILREVLRRPLTHRDHELLTYKDYFLEPLIITPQLHKKINISIFEEIWETARTELSNCKRLIIGGYSFPPTDFHMKHLFLEAFRENKLEELIVINPDSNIIKTAKELCHYRGQVKYYSDLKEFYCSYQT